jgi:predicted permease
MNPPKHAVAFLRWFCRADYLEEIEGDLTELFQKQYERSPRKAKWKFLWSVIKYFRPEFMKLFKGNSSPRSSGLYKSYFKVAWRSLARHRRFTIINVAGLTLGIACAFVIYLIVRHELSYDRYHANADRVYRVNEGMPGDLDMGTPYGLAAILRAEFPEMEEVGIVFKLNPEQSNIEINKELFREKNTYFVQPQFFRLLDFQWLQGTAESLGKPHQAVITRSIAEKYFHGDALGKVLRLNNWTDFTIAGVIADPPGNTDFPIRIAMSYATLENMKDSGLTDNLDAGSNSFSQTYFLLREDADPSTIEPKLKKMVERHLDKERRQYVAFSIEPLTDIHFTLGNFNQRIISKETIHTLQVIGLLVLVIACINFINLATAQAMRRSREVAIRKTLGSSRQSIVFQFLAEALLVTFTASVLAIAITRVSLPLLHSFFSIPVSLDALSQMDTLIFIGAVLLGVTFLSGLYPAFILSRYLPAPSLKGASLAAGGETLFARKSLITFQFLISQVLIVCTIIVIRQTNFFLSKPLGFNKEAVVTFDLPESQTSTLSALRNNLLSHSGIRDVSFSLNTPSATINKWWANLKHRSFAGEERSVEVKFIDSTYLSMFEIPKVAGTVTLPDHSGKSVIVNESLVREIGITDPEKAIGEKITYWATDATIVGVVKDFQTVTLRQGIHALILTNTGYFAKGSVKIEMAQAHEAIAYIEKHWKEAFPGNYFTYAFLDDELSTFYKEERKISKLLVCFSIVAVMIACIGLYGLVAFAATQRAKEVSIRKILGASLAHLVALLSSGFMKLVLVAGLMAWPIAYYAMDTWLQGFANRIKLLDNSWAFFLALGIGLVFALMTAIVQAIKAALVNPVTSLRTD